ncbi:hypothetical protein HanIR_Chr16g0845221 [Helianthus annuus]|nr:hypothetical protein HanIR_Chr16g0845221 [Helianthus annuus]
MRWNQTMILKKGCRMCISGRSLCSSSKFSFKALPSKWLGSGFSPSCVKSSLSGCCFVGSWGFTFSIITSLVQMVYSFAQDCLIKNSKFLRLCLKHSALGMIVGGVSYVSNAGVSQSKLDFGSSILCSSYVVYEVDG